MFNMNFCEELTSIPAGRTDEISAFVAGAKKVLAFTQTSGDFPVCVDLEFRPSGNCHIFLLRGKLVAVRDEDGNLDIVEDFSQCCLKGTDR